MTRPCAKPGCPNPVERRPDERLKNFVGRKHCSAACAKAHAQGDMPGHDLEIRRMAALGMGAVRIALELGLKKHRVDKWMRNHDIAPAKDGPLRCRGGRPPSEREPDAGPASNPSPRSVRAYEQAPACERAFFAEHIRRYAEQRMRLR